VELQLNVHWFEVFSRVNFSFSDCKPVVTSSWSSGNALGMYFRGSQFKYLKFRNDTISPYINCFQEHICYVRAGLCIVQILFLSLLFTYSQHFSYNQGDPLPRLGHQVIEWLWVWWLAKWNCSLTRVLNHGDARFSSHLKTFFSKVRVLICELKSVYTGLTKDWTCNPINESH
jgi:hypothetical protein